MYSSNYSRTKFGQDAREPLHKPRGKSCSYYLKIIFFFSSLIQSLIIVSLVLFLIYGQPEKSAEEKRVKELELGFNRLSENNIKLRKEKGELGAQLAAGVSEKAVLEKELAKLKEDANKTEQLLQRKIASCERMLMLARSTPQVMAPPPPLFTSNSEIRILKTDKAQLQAQLNLIQSNFSKTVERLIQERDKALKDQAVHLEDATRLHSDNNLLNKQIITLTRKCKEDFVHSLDGIETVTTAFLNRINNLFPHQMTFHLSCESQMAQMEVIRSSCTNLSRDVETKFQLYLDNVGNKVAEIHTLSSKLEEKNSQLSSELSRCESDKRETSIKAATDLELKQKAHDDLVERLYAEQNKMRKEKNQQEEMLAKKEKELQALQGMMPNNKAGPPKAAPPQAALQQGGKTAAI